MATITSAGTGKIETYLGAKAESLLGFKSPKIAKERLHLPGPDFIDRVWTASDRNNRVLANLQRLFHHGRLGGTGYMSILPVDQGIEHSAGASFAKNPGLLRRGKHRQAGHRGRLQRGGFHLRRARLGRAQIRAQDSLHRQNQSQRVAHLPQQIRPDLFRHREGSLRTWARRPSAPPFISAPTRADRQIVEVSQAFADAHELGMATVLWCYLRNSAFKKDKDYHLSADLTGQANHLGVTIQADIIKQKLPENNGGYQGAQHRRLQLRQARRAHLHRPRPATTPSISPATRSPIATWAAPA